MDDVFCPHEPLARRAQQNQNQPSTLKVKKYRNFTKLQLFGHKGVIHTVDGDLKSGCKKTHHHLLDVFETCRELMG